MKNAREKHTKRQKYGKTIAITAISSCLYISGCHPSSTETTTVATTQNTVETTKTEVVTEAYTEVSIKAPQFDPATRPTLTGNATLTAPVASYESGMHEKEIELCFSVPEGCYLYYTTDGSDPKDSDTAKLYTEPLLIKDRSNEKNVLHSVKPSTLSTDYVNDWLAVTKVKVDKGTVIRAILVNGNLEFSETMTHTYLIGLDNARYNNLMVLSLCTAYENLFDSKTGIYVLGDVYKEWRKKNPWGELNGATPANYNQRGRDWEREAYVEVFDSNKNVILSQGCGIRIQGGWSRSAWQKSFRMIARKEYGKGNFHAQVFDDTTLTTFDTLVMRNGGNDAGFSKLKDKVIQSLVTHRNYETQLGRPAVLFLNGEYWGIYTLTEYYDGEYFENNYGIDKDNVIFYKNYSMKEGTADDEASFDEMIRFFKEADLSDHENLEKARSMIDLDSFIDYMATQIYINNQDWPGGNFGFWKVRTPVEGNPYADGRWRMTLFDTEYSTNMYGAPETEKGCWKNNNLARVLSEDSCLSIILKSCLASDTLKERFVTVCLDLMNVEFSYDRYEEHLKEYQEQYLPELSRYYEAFPGWQTVDNSALPTIGRMSEFFRLRPSFVPTMLKTTLSLSGNDVNLTLMTNTDELNIRCNTSIITDKKIWDGVYFTDYAVTLEALEIEGCIFDSFVINSGNNQYEVKEKTLTLTLSEDTTVMVQYKK